MKPGKVVTIRLNPSDAMSVIDVVEQTGMYAKGMSYASMVSLTLSSCLQLLRQNGIIPERDGFEYNQMTSQYCVPGQNKQKLMMTDVMVNRGSDFTIKPVVQSLDALRGQFANQPSTARTEEDDIRANDEMLRARGITPPKRPWDTEQSEASPSPAPAFAEIKSSGTSIEMAEAKQEFRDLNTMRENYQDNVPGISWTSRDEDRYQELLTICLPGTSMPRLV